MVHDLVGKAFIDNPNEYPIINHKDENPRNNCAKNLEWCTYVYNRNYGSGEEKRLRSFMRDIEHQNRKRTPIIQRDKSGVFVNRYFSMAQCAKYGYNVGSVYMCCRGKRKTHKGFIWEYEKS